MAIENLLGSVLSGAHCVSGGVVCVEDGGYLFFYIVPYIRDRWAGKEPVSHVRVCLLTASSALWCGGLGGGGVRVVGLVENVYEHGEFE
jgi:hypothetical protein